MNLIIQRKLPLRQLDYLLSMEMMMTFVLYQKTLWMILNFPAKFNLWILFEIKLNVNKINCPNWKKKLKKHKKDWKIQKSRENPRVKTRNNETKLRRQNYNQISIKRSKIQTLKSSSEREQKKNLTKKLKRLKENIKTQRENQKMQLQRKFKVYKA